MARALQWISVNLSFVALSSSPVAAVHLEPVRSETGSPSDVITALVQDRYGFVWIGSRERLMLYDGYTFTSFVYDPSDPTSISDNAIRTLFEDSHGSLWIGTNAGGLNRLDRGAYTFAHYRHALEMRCCFTRPIQGRAHPISGHRPPQTRRGLPDARAPASGRFLAGHESDGPDVLERRRDPS